MTENDKKIIKDFTTHLKAKGFAKIDDETHHQTRIYNRYQRSYLPSSYLTNALDDWLYKNEKKLEGEPPSATYLMRTLPHVVGSKFAPDQPDIVVCPYSELQYINTYQKYCPTALNKAVSPLFHEFIDRLFPDEKERHTVLQWLAHMFQKPEQRPSWHLMLSSDTGCGKGVLVDQILRPLLLHVSTISSYAKLTGTFSSLLEDNLLVLLDDPKSKSESTQTQLKSKLTEEWQHIEKKGLQGKMVASYTRFILASNEDRPLYLDESERRWFVPQKLVHRISREETQEFISRLLDWVEQPGSLDAIYHFFVSYSLDGFNPKHVNQTPTLLDMVALSANPDIEFIQDFIESKGDDKTFTYQELMNAFDKDSRSRPSSKQIPHLLREVGYERKRPRINGNQISVYAPKYFTTEQVQADFGTF